MHGRSTLGDLMMKSASFATLFALSLLSASPALAVFNVQVLGGNRSAEFDVQGNGSDYDKTGSELRFAAHLDPIPLVPIAFGVSFAQTTFEDVNFANNLTVPIKGKIDGTDIDLEVEAWLPLDIAGLLPFAKLSYTVAGEYETSIDNTNIKGKYKPSGLNLSVGLKYEFLLRLGLLAQVEFGRRELKFDESENALGLTFNDINTNTTSILFGAQAGI